MGALPPVPGYSLNGVGLGTIAQAAIREARERRAQSNAVALPAPAPPANALGQLRDLLRGHTVPMLYIEATRLANLAAIHRENCEGLAYGRPYGDRDLARIDPAPCLLPILAEAALRADMAGALADLLKAMIGHEADVGQLLAGGSSV